MAQMTAPTPPIRTAAAPEHRLADAVLVVRRPDSEPLAGVDVRVRQVRHAFRFGCGLFDAIPLANDELADDALDLAERTLARWQELFDHATLPFYWARFEPERGRPDTARLRRAVDWLIARGITPKGHPLCWHTLAPDWLLPLSDDEILELQLARIRRDVGDFAGRIESWDVCNEVVIMPVFDRYQNGLTRVARRIGRLEVVKRTFAAARETDPAAQLLLNDFDLSPAYEELIEDCLAAGVPINAIGLQTHMHQGWWGVDRVLETVERFARFGLPLRFTETTIVSGELMPPEIVDLNDHQVASWPTTPDGEARQAEEVEAHYRALFGHPAVDAIVWWDFADGAWLNAPSGLVRADGSPKPAWERLRGVIRGEWWTPPTTLTTDGGGRVAWRATHGEYVADVDGRELPISLGPAGVAEQIRL
jgi:endo-1,4-beta-xylanase